MYGNYLMLSKTVKISYWAEVEMSTCSHRPNVSAMLVRYAPIWGDPFLGPVQGSAPVGVGSVQGTAPMGGGPVLGPAPVGGGSPFQVPLPWEEATLSRSCSRGRRLPFPGSAPMGEGPVPGPAPVGGGCPSRSCSHERSSHSGLAPMGGGPVQGTAPMGGGPVQGPAPMGGSHVQVLLPSEEVPLLLPWEEVTFLIPGPRICAERPQVLLPTIFPFTVFGCVRESVSSNDNGTNFSWIFCNFIHIQYIYCTMYIKF